MIQICGIGGCPGTGKTTLMLTLMSQFGEAREFRYKTLRGLAFDARRIFVLGVYDNDGGTFQGTDRLSMAVQPHAVDFVRYAAESPQYNGWTILFEGDRLFNQKFLTVVGCLVPRKKWLLLEVEESALGARRADRAARGQNQNEKFLKSRSTKYANMIEANIPDLERRPNDALPYAQANIGVVEAFIQMPSMLGIDLPGQILTE